MIRIGFLGDTCFSEIFAQKLVKNEEIISEDIIKWLNTNNNNVINLEGPLTTAKSTKIGSIPLKSAPNADVIDILKKINCNILSLSNNHIMDSGYAGLAETLDIASKNNLNHLGAGENLAQASSPVIVTRDLINVAIFGMTHQEGILADSNSPGAFSDYHEDLFRQKVAAIRKEVDWVVLIYHGGEEYTFIPMPQRRKKLKRFLDYGVDIIVCHHSHVTQGYEFFGNKYIFYSLGNFIFDTASQRKMAGTSDGVLLRLTFSKNSVQFGNVFTHFDRKKILVEQRLDNANFVLLDDKNYLTDWRKDAARIIFSRSSNENLNNPGEKSTVKNNNKKGSIISKYGINKKNYYALKYVLFQKNMRAIFLSALNYKLRILLNKIIVSGKL